MADVDLLVVTGSPDDFRRSNRAAYDGYSGAVPGGRLRDFNSFESDE